MRQQALQWIVLLSFAGHGIPLKSSRRHCGAPCVPGRVGESLRGERCDVCPSEPAIMATFLEAEWRHLLMAHYRVEHAILSPYVPAGTELDEWGGHVYVSLIGFRFLRTRVLGIGVPFHRNFDEINLRLYVRRRTDGEVRRGVVFVKEVVSTPGVALAANLTFNENYEVHATRSNAPRVAGAVPGSLRYEWRSRSGWNRVSADLGDGPFVPAPGSREHFLVERPWGSTRQRDGGTVEYRVDHPPWRVWRTREASVQCHVRELYGAEFEHVLRPEPDLATIAEGSAVAVSTPSRVA